MMPAERLVGEVFARLEEISRPGQRGAHSPNRGTFGRLAGMKRGARDAHSLLDRGDSDGGRDDRVRMLGTATLVSGAGEVRGPVRDPGLSRGIALPSRWELHASLRAGRPVAVQVAQRRRRTCRRKGGSARH